MSQNAIFMKDFLQKIFKIFKRTTWMMHDGCNVKRFMDTKCSIDKGSIKDFY